MIQKAMLRSGLQLVGLCLVAALFSTTPLQGFDDECPDECSFWNCTDKAAECSLQCGETVTWTYNYAWEHYWEHNTGEWGIHWHHETHPVWNYQYGSGIQNFECDEQAQTSSCICTYR